MCNRGYIVYGGSFNPLHIGHMRLAIECLAMMGELVAHLEFLPSAAPPHKQGEPMLPFAMRTQMIDATIAGQPAMLCNPIEASRPGPSFTYETLSQLKKERPDAPVYFLIGSQDFLLLPTWHKGLQLTDFCNLVIVPRGNFDQEEFRAHALRFWPGSDDISMFGTKACLGGSGYCIRLKNGASLYWLPIHYIDISSSRIRKLWLCGKSITYLVPGQVEEILAMNRQAVKGYWQEKTCSM